MSNPFDFSDERQKRTEAWQPTNMLPSGEPVPPAAQQPQQRLQQMMREAAKWPTEARVLVWVLLLILIGGPIAWAVYYFDYLPAKKRRQKAQRELYEIYRRNLWDERPDTKANRERVIKECQDRWGKHPEDFERFPPSDSSYYD